MLNQPTQSDRNPRKAIYIYILMETEFMQLKPQTWHEAQPMHGAWQTYAPTIDYS